MQKLKFTLELNAVDLRDMAATLLGMAKQIERDISPGEPSTIEEDHAHTGSKTYDVDGRQYTADQIRNGGWDREQLALVKVSESDILEIFGPVKNDDGQTTANANPDADNEGDAVTNNVELDAEGLPHDARIHAPSKLKLKRECTWKLKKSIDPVLVENVKAELREAMAAPAATTKTSSVKPKSPASPAGPASPAAPKPPVVEVKYVTSDGEWTRAQLLDAGYDDAGVDALPIANDKDVTVLETTTGVTFPELMQLVTPALAAKTITDEQVTAACVKHGVASIALIAARLDLIPAVKTELFG